MKKMNANVISKLAIAVLLLVITSCQDLLEFQPSTSLSDVTAFSSPSTIELAVVGVYNAAQSGFYAGGVDRGYPFGAAHVEQGDNRGEDVNNTATFYAITYDATYTPTTANNDYMWQTLYALINKANVVIAGLDKAVAGPLLTQATIDNYKGEMLFLRALAHHELLKHFARPYSDNPTAANKGVVLAITANVDAATADAASQVGRSTVQECYDQILADLDDAETFLPDTRSPIGIKISRATKAAAIALKTRVYLHMSDWANVILEGNKLAAQSVAPFSSTIGAHSLMSSPMGAFTSGGSKNNTESIFSIENADVNNPGTNAALPRMYNGTSQSGRALVAISPKLWNNTWFLATDFRKSDAMIAQDPTGAGRAAKFTKKYSDATSWSDNAPVIRYAEVLLNMAEAIQRQSATPNARALELLNAVRNRAVTEATDQFTISSFATDDDLITAVLRERRIEFVCEGLRWGDIHRLAQDATFGTGGIPEKASRLVTNWTGLYTGDPATTYNVLPAIPYSDYRFVWPIPLSETSVNPVLAAQQNPGY